MAKKETSLVETLKYSEVKAMVKTCIEIQEPIMIWGAPGIGKSDMIFEIGKELDRPIIDIRLSLLDQVDIRGIPFLKDDKMQWAPNSDLPHNPDDKSIIFLDEINAADQSTLKAMYQLILNRKIGDYTLPKGVAMVAAGNREEDSCGIFRMPSALENRFIHSQLDVDFKEWLLWAVSKQVHPDVVGFLNSCQDKLVESDFSNASRSFATPRSWAKTSKVIYAIESDKRGDENQRIRHGVAGCVGSGLAVNFMAFKKIAGRLPDPEKVIEGKVDTKQLSETLKGEPALAYTLVTSVLYCIQRLNKEKEQPKDKNSEYIENLLAALAGDGNDMPEFIAMAMTQAYQVYGIKFQIDKMPRLHKFLKDNKEILSQITTNERS